MVHFDATVGNSFVGCIITYHPRVNFLIILGSNFFTYNASRLQKWLNQTWTKELGKGKKLIIYVLKIMAHKNLPFIENENFQAERRRLKGSQGKRASTKRLLSILSLNFKNNWKYQKKNYVIIIPLKYDNCKIILLVFYSFTNERNRQLNPQQSGTTEKLDRWYPKYFISLLSIHERRESPTKPPKHEKRENLDRWYPKYFICLLSVQERGNRQPNSQTNVRRS